MHTFKKFIHDLRIIPCMCMYLVNNAIHFILSLRRLQTQVKFSVKALGNISQWQSGKSWFLGAFLNTDTFMLFVVWFYLAYFCIGHCKIAQLFANLLTQSKLIIVDIDCTNVQFIIWQNQICYYYKQINPWSLVVMSGLVSLFDWIPGRQ